ncbi:MAG: DinB family protein [Ferruginibacter sp.]
MKTVFDNTTRDELIGRIGSLNENSQAQWGKMNIYQMLSHCVLCEEMYLGKSKYKRKFIGRLFGRIGLKNLLKDEHHLKRNSPTSPDFKITENQGNALNEKMKWIALIKEYAYFSNDDFVHWFFGKMTKEQVGYFVYKHTDHHLRQFNV